MRIQSPRGMQPLLRITKWTPTTSILKFFVREIFFRCVRLNQMAFAIICGILTPLLPKRLTSHICSAPVITLDKFGLLLTATSVLDEKRCAHDCWDKLIREPLSNNSQQYVAHLEPCSQYHNLQQEILAAV